MKESYLNFFLIKNIYNFLTFFIFYLWLPIFYFILFKFQKKNIKFQSLFEKKTISDYFAIITIFVAAIAPYILAGKSTDLFFFTDYYG